MYRIHLNRLRTLLQLHLYPQAGVIASVGGGWFVQRPKIAR